MGDRRCEGCNGTIPVRTHRQKNDKGQMVCEECIRMNTPTWTAGLAYAAGLSPAAEQEMRQRMVASIASVARVLRTTTSTTKTAHDSGDNAIINHCPFCGSGAVIGGGDGTVSCDFCHTNFTVQVQPAHPFMPQTVDGQPVPPAGMPGEQPTEMSAPLDPAVNETEEGVVEDPAQAAGATPFNGPPKPDAEDDKPKGENPFAKGSALASLGAKWALAQDRDGALVHTATNDAGEPIGSLHGYDRTGARAVWGGLSAVAFDVIVGTEYVAEKVTGLANAKKVLEQHVPKQASVAYRTDDGRTLDESAYMARLALAHADNRDEVLDVVRMRHTAAGGATVTCPRCTGSGTEPDGTDMACSSCDGTGLVWVKVPGVEAKMAVLSAVTIKASEVQVGDRLDISGKTRVSQRHPRTDKVLVQTRTNGVRSPSVKKWANDEDIRVYRDTAKQADLLNPETGIDDNARDLLAEHDAPFDGDLLADNGLGLPDQFHRPSREWLDMIQWGADR